MLVVYSVQANNVTPDIANPAGVTDKLRMGKVEYLLGGEASRGPALQL